MKILAFDTCFGTCSVALCIEGVIHSTLLETENSKQAERLLPMIESLLKNAKITYDAINYIAITAGPGGFTGTRIGMSAAYGICITKQIPLLTISTLELIAWEVQKTHLMPFFVALHASLNKFYCQFFHEESTELINMHKNHIKKILQNTPYENINFYDIMCSSEPFLAELEFLNKIQNYYAIFGNHNQEQNRMPEAITLALLSYEKINNCAKQSIIDFSDLNCLNLIEPMYLRSFS